MKSEKYSEWSGSVIDALGGAVERSVDFLKPLWRGISRKRYPAVPSDARVERALGDPDTCPVLPTSSAPRVSVIIPVYGKFATTFWCLQSLGRTRCDTPYEVIVVDDCSGDFTPEMLARLPSVRSLRNAENLGFIGSCNAGARIAHGEYLCFLNNDTRVTDGWLDALVQTFTAFPKAGMVGGKLLFPDGSLQEAGGTVFRNGACSHYGRNRDESRPEYNYVRPADYCSGACLCLPKSLFEKLDGFDVRYRPAYYEDTDLAFRVRALGLQVLYQPGCKVVHYEGVTHGKNPSQGLKRHQTINRAVFLDRWKTELATHPALGNRSWSAGERRLSPGPLLIFPRELPALQSTLGQLLQEASQQGQRAGILTDQRNAAAIAAWNARGVEVIVTSHGAGQTLQRLSSSSAARYACAVFDGAQAAERFAKRVRRRAPHLSHWLLPDKAGAFTEAELSALGERMDRVLSPL